MKVQQLMTNEVLSLPQTSGLFEVIANMTETTRSCVVICQASKPTGIITERDIVRHYASQISAGKIEDISVEAVMTRDPICCLFNADVYEALLLARHHRVRHIPVVDQRGLLVGILSQTDTLEAYLSAWEKTAELQEANEHLTLLSMEDSLLKIGNRRALNIDLTHIDSSSKRSSSPYAIAMIDVDNFKLYNDHYGHQQGDTALVKLVQTINDNKREGDRVYRYGGEEILLLMPDTNLSQAKSAAERVRYAIEVLALSHEACERHIVTVSIGVSASDIKKPWKKTIKRADEALYLAKKSGKNITLTAK